MRSIAWEEFWWNNITGARTVVEDVSLALQENKSVILLVPSDLPWRHTMRGAIQAAIDVRTESKDILIEAIDAVDNMLPDERPGRFILRQFSPSNSIRTGYREKARKSIQDYIVEHQVLKNRILWVKGMDEKAAQSWVEFCQGYSSFSAQNGLFVLETHAKLNMPDSKTIRVIDCVKRLSDYDVQQFNSLILDENPNLSSTWKRYISTSAAVVCGIDAEVSELLLRLVDYRSETAVDGLQKVHEMGDFDRRGTEPSSNHPLWHYRNHNTAELLHKIWTAQIQVLFPLIELERQNIIEKYQDLIKAALENYSILQYGEVLSNPMEVELGTLCYMMSSGGSYQKLSIPDSTDRERIRFLHNCRNKLAHMDCCSPVEITRLLG